MPVHVQDKTKRDEINVLSDVLRLEFHKWSRDNSPPARAAGATPAGRPAPARGSTTRSLNPKPETLNPKL